MEYIQTKGKKTQLLVPKSHQDMLFQAAHHNPISWPISTGIHSNVHKWCAACCEWHLLNLLATPKLSLCPLPLIEVPFERN